jgi:hypothetical protein
VKVLAKTDPIVNTLSQVRIADIPGILALWCGQLPQ